LFTLLRGTVDGLVDRFGRPGLSMRRRFGVLFLMSSVPKLTLILGGARSGKSRYAESLIAALPPPWIYIATPEPAHQEIATRLTSHRERRGAHWRTVEAPRELASALATCGEAPVLVDCLTLWLSNLMLADVDIEVETAQLEKALGAANGPVVAVANEVGSG